MILIPKVLDVISIEQFRPIVLSNFCLKIVTKILADWLALIATRIISCNQIGFLKNRSIHDCIVGASKGINLINKACYGGNMAMKIDIRKAFDTVD